MPPGDLMPEELNQAMAISVNAAARKYRVPQSTLSRWAARGRIKILVRPEKHGQKMLVDERSVIAAIESRQRYLPRFSNDHQNPLIKYCPYCGKPLPNT